MKQHPCTLYGEDRWTGVVSLGNDYCLAMELRSCPRTYSPPVIFGLLASNSREQGYGAATLFKQRALRWYCIGTRLLPSFFRHLVGWRASDIASSVCFRFAMAKFIWDQALSLSCPWVLLACVVRDWHRPYEPLVRFWGLMLFECTVHNFGVNCILLLGSPEHQAGVVAVVYASFLDVLLQIFQMIGNYKCLFYDIWHPAEKWRVGCWKKYEHLCVEPAGGYPQRV